MNLIDEFGQNCIVRTCLKNEQLLLKEERAQWIAQIVSGNVIVQSYRKDGQLVVLRECRVGEIVGSFDVNSGAELRCLKETRAVYLSRQLFVDALKHNNCLRSFILSQFYLQLTDVERRLSSAIIGSVSDRIIDELTQREQKLGAVLPITQSELSVRVGASRETISRELIKLEDRGIIYRDNKHYYIINLDKEP